MKLPSNYLLDSLAESLDISIPHPTQRQTQEALSAGGIVMITTKRALDIISLDHDSKKQNILATSRKGEKYLDKGCYIEHPAVFNLGFKDSISGAIHIGNHIDRKHLDDAIFQVNALQQSSSNQYLTDNDLFKLYGMTKERLSFGDFICLCNNFHLHFLTLGWISYGEKVAEKFKKENGELYSEIQGLVEKKRNGGLSMEENFVRLKKLYQAYCIAIQYPFVEHNYELFR